MLQRSVALLNVGLVGKEIVVPLAQLLDFEVSRLLTVAGSLGAASAYGFHSPLRAKMMLVRIMLSQRFA